MIIFAGQVFGASTAGFLTVWVSPTTNFTATGTKCVEGIGILPGVDTAVTCPAAAGTQYVTIERRDVLTEDILVINELQVFRSSEFHLPACMVSYNCCQGLHDCSPAVGLHGASR